MYPEAIALYTILFCLNIYSVGTQYKTPKKTFTFTGIKTPAMTSKSVYNLDESIKKKPSYKIHKGK